MRAADVPTLMILFS